MDAVRRESPNETKRKENGGHVVAAQVTLFTLSPTR